MRWMRMRRTGTSCRQQHLWREQQHLSAHSNTCGMSIINNSCAEHCTLFVLWRVRLAHDS